ncbi:TPR repeat-containing protein NMB0313 precursor [Phocoenobacter uteri]|uniref:TPR repeat-containing protein NMB0313 n=1 Tax=Phocoenobacter uteri TaxID=146806 RepID=A0A379CC35_9PAST|nr:surface lipoprotein assembly modifier [Phocoenobacter uteri]SUB59843.1 TPR repeat-containing protein NMB0313 precursor [Phocoenobacter uteri]
MVFAYTQEPSKAILNTYKKLDEQPDKLLTQLVNALLQTNVDAVSQLFPLYSKLPKSFQTKDIRLWSLAILSASKGEHLEALNYYEKLHNIYPEMLPLKFQWGMSLFANRRYYEAKRIFTELKGKINSQVPNQILEHIDLEHKWNLLGNFNVVSNYNVNQGNSSQNGWTFGEPRHTYGIHLGIGLEKRWHLPKGFFINTKLMTESDFYPKYKPLNYLSIYSNFGIGYQDTKKEIQLTPFSEIVFNNMNSHFDYGATILGFKTQMNYNISSRWQVGTEYKVQYRSYHQENEALNNHIHKIDVMTLFKPRLRTNLKTNIFYEESFYNSIFKSKGYKTFGVGVLWNEIWGSHLGSQFSMEYYQSRYKGLKMIFNTTEKKSTVNLGIAIWNPKWSMQGVIPKLHFSYSLVKSNIDLFSYKEPKIFIEVFKPF